LGLKDVEALRSFCMELSNDQPSPGGGTASAAVGAMAASLMIMVCGMTGRSKKHMDHWKEIKDLETALVRRRDGLISLAKEDALAYDALFEASRRLRASETTKNRESFQASLRHAAEVPIQTASECHALLGQSVTLASLQTRSASSDTLVAVMLAEAGFEGASANIEINLRDIADIAFSQRTREGLKVQSTEVKTLVQDALSRLQEPDGSKSGRDR
jgi:formiminotetrahydrofolate cyclodeaminase